MPQHPYDWSVYIINLRDCREVADCDFALDVKIQKTEFSECIAE